MMITRFLCDFCITNRFHLCLTYTKLFPVSFQLDSIRFFFFVLIIVSSGNWIPFFLHACFCSFVSNPIVSTIEHLLSYRCTYVVYTLNWIVLNKRKIFITFKWASRQNVDVVSVIYFYFARARHLSITMMVDRMKIMDVLLLYFFLFCDENAEI